MTLRIAAKDNACPTPGHQILGVPNIRDTNLVSFWQGEWGCPIGALDGVNFFHAIQVDPAATAGDQFRHGGAFSISMGTGSA